MIETAIKVNKLKLSYMNGQNKKFFLIKIAYRLGIGADAFWAVVLIFPKLFGILFGIKDFNPDLQTRLIMGIGGTMMTGWTFHHYGYERFPIASIIFFAFPNRCR